MCIYIIEMNRGQADDSQWNLIFKSSALVSYVLDGHCLACQLTY